MRKVSFYKLLSLGILISMIVSCSERDEDLPLKNSNSKITETEKIEKKTLAKKAIDSIQTNDSKNDKEKALKALEFAKFIQGKSVFFCLKERVEILRK
jgi:uncharacterized protein YegP (UPF0339 family)